MIRYGTKNHREAALMASQDAENWTAEDCEALKSIHTGIGVKVKPHGHGRNYITPQGYIFYFHETLGGTNIGIWETFLGKS